MVPCLCQEQNKPTSIQPSSDDSIFPSDNNSPHVYEKKKDIGMTDIIYGEQLIIVNIV